VKKDERIAKRYKQYRLLLQTYVKNNGLRYTAERDLVLHYCCETEAPITPDKLIERGKEDHISRATVYNALRVLSDARIIQTMKRHWGMGIQEYELVPQEVGRCLFQCTRCGRIVEFKDKSFTVRLRERRFNNFKMDTYSLYVYGTCQTCGKKTMLSNN